MPCCNLQYFLCFKKKEKRRKSFIGELPKKNSVTIKKKRESEKIFRKIHLIFARKKKR